MTEHDQPTEKQMTQPPIYGPQQRYQPQQQPPNPQQPIQMRPQQFQPMMQPPPPKQKRFGWLALLIAAFVALGIGGIVGGAGDNPSAVPAPTVTVTETEEAAPADEPTATDEPTEEPAAFKPKRKDFEIGVKTLKKECFGSAGCNVTFRIKPKYVGSQSIPDSGTVEVTYRVVGGEDPVENTFTVEDGSASFDKEEYASTSSSGSKLRAKVLDVSYDG